jgi:hypothetical protein
VSSQVLMPALKWPQQCATAAAVCSAAAVVVVVMCVYVCVGVYVGGMGGQLSCGHTTSHHATCAPHPPSTRPPPFFHGSTLVVTLQYTPTTTQLWMAPPTAPTCRSDVEQLLSGCVGLPPPAAHISGQPPAAAPGAAPRGGGSGGMNAGLVGQVDAMLMDLGVSSMQVCCCCCCLCFCGCVGL